MLIQIDDAEKMSTQKLLEAVLTQLNQDNRVRLIVSRGRGQATVQCLRVKLSRTRKKLEKKGRRPKIFKLHSDVFPWTELDGSRRDCVILHRSVPADLHVLETLEGLLNNGTATQLA